MGRPLRATLPWWAGAAACLAVLAVAWGRSPTGAAVLPVAVALVGAVLMAVRHAEVIAHRVGEPFGTLILAVSVTAIEVGLVVALTAGGKPDASTLARDTVFAAVMLVLNLIVGLCVVVGALRHRVLHFNPHATTALLATLALLAGLTLVLPRFTSSTPGPRYSGTQLAFASACALGIYVVFVLVQTVFDRDTFVGAPSGTAATVTAPAAGDEHRPSMWGTSALLVVCLAAVVGLAKVSSGAIDQLVTSLGATKQLEGVVLAGLVLLPETIAAARAAWRDDAQTGFNLALGSGIASIGLTVPAVALSTLWIDTPLVLGLPTTQLVLLTLSVVLAALSLGGGRVTLLHGVLHLALALVFVFLTIEP